MASHYPSHQMHASQQSLGTVAISPTHLTPAGSPTADSCSCVKCSPLSSSSLVEVLPISNASSPGKFLNPSYSMTPLSVWVTASSSLLHVQFLPGAQGCFLKWSLPLIVSLVALGTFMGACTYFSSSLMDCKIYKSRTIHSHVHTCSTVRVWGGWGWDPGWSEVSWRWQCQTMSKIHMDLQWEDGIPSRVH